MANHGEPNILLRGHEIVPATFESVFLLHSIARANVRTTCMYIVSIVCFLAYGNEFRVRNEAVESEK